MAWTWGKKDNCGIVAFIEGSCYLGIKDLLFSHNRYEDGECAQDTALAPIGGRFITCSRVAALTMHNATYLSNAKTMRKNAIKDLLALYKRNV